jgi:hypothetical protein
MPVPIKSNSSIVYLLDSISTRAINIIPIIRPSEKAAKLSIIVYLQYQSESKHTTNPTMNPTNAPPKINISFIASSSVIPSADSSIVYLHIV